MKKYRYEIGDERFGSKKLAIERRKLLNVSAKKGDVNIINKVLKTPSGWIVRAKTKK